MNRYLIQHYIEANVRRNPGKTAIVYCGLSITYGQLWNTSGLLADNLVAAGYTQRRPVGIFMHKSIDAVVAMLAVLRAGGMYIPLDSHYSPVARIAQILQSSETDFLISDSSQWKALESCIHSGNPPFTRATRVILTDTMLGERTGSDAEIVSACGHYVRFFDPGIRGAGSYDSTITDEDFAYILYTSGSTGVPKGVALTHRNARTFIDWALDCFAPGESEVFSNIAPLHFDLSVFDVYVSLASGAAVKLVPHGTSMNPRGLLSWIRDEGITCFYSVPSVWIAMLRHAGLKKGDLPLLTHILFAGEVFPPARLKALMNAIPQARYFNLYGPTETNVCAYHEVKSLADVKGEPVPIGRACANTELLVLKENGEPASVFEKGELLVKGSIVTRGYYRDARSTGAAFTESPLEWHHRALFYKTGDIVRVLAPGVYGYVGRKDLMVKCGGFRVELQEVEAALSSHRGISEAVAVPVFGEDSNNAAYIAAFVTARPGCNPGVIALKEHIAFILPRYMIPEAIVFLDEIPRNANCKADRQLLTARAAKLEAVASMEETWH